MPSATVNLLGILKNLEREQGHKEKRLVPFDFILVFMCS